MAAGTGIPKRDLVRDLPDQPGVYLFYDAKETLLYVGKSVTVRSRVRAHFNERSERRMCRMIRRIEVRRTAGEMGALLLESRLIKELRPLYNVAQRRRRKIVLARRLDNADGYATVLLQEVDQVAFDPAEPILGIFKHAAQAKEFLELAARNHRLCAKLLRLEQARSYCFAYHLHRCDGACMGEESAEAYNGRVESAFAERRIQAWKFEGPIAVDERLPDGSLTETFVIDNWCLLGSRVVGDDGGTRGAAGSHRFDFDAYKILYSFVSNPPATMSVRLATADDLTSAAEGPAAGRARRTEAVKEREQRRGAA